MCIFCILIEKCVCLFCSPLFKIFSTRRCINCINFLCGCALGQAYYYYLLTRIPLSYNIGVILSILLSVILGISNTIAIQIRCISLLLFPMYCGKAGRGVLKVIVLTYVVAGPITNMGKNAREVVRVFSCCTQLSYNISKTEHSLLLEPIMKTALSLRSEMEELKETFRTVNNVIGPIEREMEDLEDIQMDIDSKKIFFVEVFSQQIDGKSLSEQQYTVSPRLRYNKKFYQNLYQKKLVHRCEDQLKQMNAVCSKIFETAYDHCLEVLLPKDDAWTLCWPLRHENACNIINFIPRNVTCNGFMQIDPGFEEGYLALKEFKHELTRNLKDVHLQYKVTNVQDLYDMQDAKETGERIMHAFEEKTTLMSTVFVVLNLYVGILILRIQAAAIYYHDKYLLSIEYDNVYITKYFKLLDKRRKERHKMTLLPLKKMERSKYIDVNSKSQRVVEHSKLVTQILKVMLEVVTATTFVMLDRLFYEALDVVRQHAQKDIIHTASDMKIEVEGTGMLASLLRKLLSGFPLKSVVYYTATNEECLPHPRAIPSYYYFKIYGGYLWILFLLYIDPYTMRLRRLICSYFYPHREKQRILHLYNDILKKRMKMPKTLRRKAVQSVRAYYLSGENLLSLRTKFPQTLGWLRILPAARMTCLICSETEPRNHNTGIQCWYTCGLSKCPFVYCGECWREAGARCLACDPSLAELSDMDSLSEDEHPRY